MAKLPSVSDLGPTPDVSGNRPIGGYDVAPLARGAQQFGAGVNELAGAVKEIGLAKERMEYQLANAGFMADHINLQSTLTTGSN